MKNGNITIIIIISVIILLILTTIYIITQPLESLKTLLSENEYNTLENLKVQYNQLNSCESIQIGKLPLPITTENYTITSYFGFRANPISTTNNDFHTGIDIVPSEWHSNIIAVYSGTVTFAGVQNGYGNCVEIKHTTDTKINWYTFYAHLSQINVANGQHVEAKNIIGIEGGAKSDPNHGFSMGHHCHFEIRLNSGYGHAINPYPYLF